MEESSRGPRHGPHNVHLFAELLIGQASDCVQTEHGFVISTSENPRVPKISPKSDQNREIPRNALRANNFDVGGPISEIFMKSFCLIESYRLTYYTLCQYYTSRHVKRYVWAVPGSRAARTPARPTQRAPNCRAPDWVELLIGLYVRRGLRPLQRTFKMAYVPDTTKFRKSRDLAHL
ncbi:hypothetical protein Ddc_19677 [Ditylenchus destructor]|nr:hypothetical protein Ddc_19677 [Ditylenchus destructor]